MNDFQKVTLGALGGVLVSVATFAAISPSGVLSSPPRQEQNSQPAPVVEPDIVFAHGREGRAGTVYVICHRGDKLFYTYRRGNFGGMAVIAGHLDCAR